MAGLVLMTEPFERVLGLIPKGVMAGLFVSLPFSSLSEPRIGLKQSSGIWAPTPC